MQCLPIAPFSVLFTQNEKYFTNSIFVINIDRTRTPPLLSRVRYQKIKPNGVCFYRRWYHSRQNQVQRFRIVGLAYNHTMDRIIFSRQKCSLVRFLITYFQRYLERSGDVPITIPKFRFVCFLSKSCHILQIVSYSQFYYFNRQKYLANFKCLAI